MDRRRLLAGLAAAALARRAAAGGFTSAEARARRPELFDPATGLRVSRYRAPTPVDAPGATVLDHAGLLSAISDGAALLDVAPEGAGVWFGGAEGWVGAQPRATIPGAVWAPGAGRGTLDPEMAAYLDSILGRLTAGAPRRAIVAFCFADCWMSWNAAVRLAARGLQSFWYPLGTDGWTEAGGALAETLPAAP